jgi:hypothetical protein
MRPLEGISVPCPIDDIVAAWHKARVLERLQADMEAAAVRLPPAHLQDGSQGVLLDLTNLGLVGWLPDERVNLPDVYRVGYRIGRRGGLKPVAR